jgi:SAM-dependent methyltransferase
VRDKDNQSYFRQFFDERAQSNIAAYTGAEGNDPYQTYAYGDRLRRLLNDFSRLQLPQGALILDAGCGANPLVFELANKGYEAVGVDQSYEMVRSNADHHAGIYGEADGMRMFSQASITNLPFRPGIFDVIFCLGVLPYLPSEDEALREMHRVLKPNGHVLLSVRNKYNLPALLDFPELIRRRLARRRRSPIRTSSNQQKAPPARLFSIPKFLQTATQVGYSVKSVRGMRYGKLHFFGKTFLPPKVDILISRMLDTMGFIPGIRHLAVWQNIKLKKCG